MADYVEMWSPTGRQIVALSGGRATAGTRLENDIVVSGDTSVSGFHLVFEAYGPGWALRDMGSRNGTLVNGDRLLGERVLRDGDEIALGRTRLVFRTEDAATQPPTDSDGDRPDITKRERDVLIELCRPVLDRDLFTEPATVREISETLVVSETAVKQHLGNLYAKFGIEGESERRRSHLANEAIRRGVISLADLRATTL